jgi:hypothetical protein
MPVDVIAVLILMGLIAAGAVTVMRLLRPAQRAVVVVGLLATLVQVCYPPCIEVGVDGLPRPGNRHVIGAVASYSPSDRGFWIDADRQWTLLGVTLIATAAVCGLMAYLPVRRPPDAAPPAA